MTLGDLLSELRENILHDRSHRVAGSEDYLWTDATLVRYIDEAQRRFARKAMVIRDGSTPCATVVTLREGINVYTLHESVLAVLSAQLTSAPGDLARAGHTAFDGPCPSPSAHFNLAHLSVQAPGRPQAFSTDEQVGFDDFDTSGAVTLRVYPTPDAAHDGETLNLRVIRLPIERFDVKRKQQRPEIPEDHHLEMLDWAAYLALRIVDIDAGNPQRALEFRASFDEHVKAARTSVMRKLFAPQQWGFGRNGFAWER